VLRTFLGGNEHVEFTVVRCKGQLESPFTRGMVAPSYGYGWSILAFVTESSIALTVGKTISHHCPHVRVDKLPVNIWIVRQRRDRLPKDLRAVQGREQHPL
jgi:hypothetical protein